MLLKSIIFEVRKLVRKNWEKPTKPLKRTQTVSILKETEEPISEYRPGGYCPVFIGEKLQNGRYEIVRKLGWGVYSTVWLAKDKYQNQYVALKILKSIVHGKVLNCEIDILEYIREKREMSSDHEGLKHLPQLLDFFTHKSPCGKHDCLVFPVLGPHLGHVLDEVFGGEMPLNLLKQGVRQILTALYYLHDICGVIHTDIKVDNILFGWKDETAAVNAYLKSNPYPVGLRYSYFDYVHSEKLRTKDMATLISDEFILSDLGVARWKTSFLKGPAQPHAFRAPEIISGCKWNEKVDIWNLGLLIPEITGWAPAGVAPGVCLQHGEYDYRLHFRQIASRIGPIPKKLWENNKLLSEDFTSNGYLKKPLHDPCPMKNWMRGQGHLAQAADPEWVTFIRELLIVDPEERPSAVDLLRHPFFEEPSEPELPTAPLFIAPDTNREDFFEINIPRTV